MVSKVVLGHPYHGAFYWLCSAEGWRKTALKSAPNETHPYYKTLYGRAPHGVLDELVSLCLLYDDIYLAPADCPLPDFQARSDGRKYENPELGLISDYGWEGDRQELDETVRDLTTDLEVQHQLETIPPSARTQVIRTAVVQLKIREETGADLLAGPAHLRLWERISKLIGTSREVADREKLLRGLKAVYDTASLRFSIENLDDFIALRSAKSVREYAVSFRRTLDTLPSGPGGELSLFKAMAEAMNKSDIADRVRGGLSVGASLAGVVSLVPLVGTIAGAAGLTADGASRMTERWSGHHKWWTLAPEISKVLTRARIEARFKALERGGDEALS